MLEMIRRRHDSQSIGLSTSFEDPFSGDVLPANLTPMNLFFLFIVESFCTRTVNYTLAKKKATKNATITRNS